MATAPKRAAVMRLLIIRLSTSETKMKKMISNQRKRKKKKKKKIIGPWNRRNQICKKLASTSFGVTTIIK